MWRLLGLLVHQHSFWCEYSNACPGVCPLVARALCAVCTFNIYPELVFKYLLSVLCSRFQTLTSCFSFASSLTTWNIQVCIFFLYHLIWSCVFLVNWICFEYNLFPPNTVSAIEENISSRFLHLEQEDFFTREYLFIPWCTYARVYSVLCCASTLRVEFLLFHMQLP